MWIYDNRTNVHHTLKHRPLRNEDLRDFIQCYQPGNHRTRRETWSEGNPEGRWWRFTLEEIMKRDKISLDIFHLKDKSLGDLDNLPEPDELAEEIIENIEAGLEGFRSVLSTLTST